MKSSEAIAFPVIAEPEHQRQTEAAQAAERHHQQSAPVRLTRYAIQPSTSFQTTASSGSAAPTPYGVWDGLQLFSYVSTAQGDVPPEEVAVIPEGPTTLRGGEGPAESDGEEPDAEDDPLPSTAVKRASRKRGRRTAPATRVHYSTHLSAPSASDGVQYVSVPVPEYKGLACVLLRLPRAAPAPPSTEEVVPATANAIRSSSAGTVIEATALTRPMLELKVDSSRSSSRFGPSLEAERNVRKDGQSISTGWHVYRAAQASGFNKADWRKLDAMEAADAERPVVAHEKPVTFTGATDGLSTGAKPTRQTESGRAAQAKLKFLEEKQGLKGLPKAGPPKTSSPPPVVLSQAAPPPRTCVAVSPAAPLPEDDLPGSAAAAIEALRQAGGPSMALAALEKLVLKSLASYTVMLHKFRDPDQKAEANQWFRHRREEFRQWLAAQGIKIDPQNMVCL